jgi:hypothetical protein
MTPPSANFATIFASVVDTGGKFGSNRLLIPLNELEGKMYQ